MTNQTFNLDLIPQGVPPIVHVSQYDKGQTWEIHLHENGIVFPVPANTSAAIQGTKPDNTGFQFPAVITAGDNVVMFTLEQQMTVFSGDIDCELVLVNGDDQVATINFILSVEPTTLDDDTVISETQLPLIEQAAELGAVINNYATQIHADAETASTAATAATAAATSASADATTATAAADDATASKTAAASSASNAATSETNAAASAMEAASSESNAATSEANAAASAAEAARVAATDMTGATASTAGTHGLVPAPAAGDDTKFLGGDGTWKDVPAELSGLTDVTLTSPVNGQILRYDATAQKWRNADLSYVGMIIHSTTLDTEAKVKAVYGGASWVKIEGVFLLGESATHAIGSTGGEETHILSANEMPSHAHGEYINTSGGSRYPYTLAGGGGESMAGNYFGSATPFGVYTGQQCLTGATGGGQAHNNMPPYKTVYIWERTA